MHPSNRAFWQYCEGKYSRYFHGPNTIVECGSYNINGVVREHFSGFSEYIGVDWREGPCVDYVSFIHEIPEEFSGRFSTLISSSLLEHDPFWVESLRRMTSLLTPEGAMFLSWGGMLNRIHDCEHSKDCQFHPLSPKKVFFVLESLGMYVHEFGYESKFDGEDGMVYLIAFKKKENAIGESVIEKFIQEDLLELTEEEMERFRGKPYYVEYVEPVILLPNKLRPKEESKKTREKPPSKKSRPTN